MKVIIDKALFNKEAAVKVTGFNDLKSSLEEYTPEKVSIITGIPADEIIAAAETFAKAKSRIISLSVSASENTKGMDTVLAAANLINLLDDNSGALQIPAEYSNTYGLYQMEVRPGDQAHSMGISEMLYSEDSALHALYIMGEDPAVTFPDSSKVIKRLKSLDFMIVQDIFLTETAKLANVVLPASSWGEKDGTFTNAEGNLQKVYRVVDPAGESVPDWMILKNLTLTMGQELGVRNLQAIQEEIKVLLTKKPQSEKREGL